MAIKIEIDENKEELLREVWGGELERAAFEGLLVESYRQGKLGSGDVAHLLGLKTSIDGQQWLGERGAYPGYTDEQLAEDRKTLTRHFPDPKS